MSRSSFLAHLALLFFAAMPARGDTQAAELAGRAAGYSAFLPIATTPESRPAVHLEEGHRLISALSADASHRTFIACVQPEPALPEAQLKTPGSVIVGCLDHQTLMVSHPTILRLPIPPSDIASISIAADAEGFVWVCAASRQQRTPCLFKTVRPQDIADFESIDAPPLSRATLHVVPGQGFVLLGARPVGTGTALCAATSADGRTWHEPVVLAAVDTGQVFVSAQFRNKLGVAFSSYAAGAGPAATDNIGYIETADGGRTWQTIRRARLTLPVQGEVNPARVADHRSIRWTVHLKDLNFDHVGNPIILYLLGRPQRNRPPKLTWTTSRWIGREWETTGVIPAAGSEDSAVLHVDADRTWRLFTARTGPSDERSPSLVCWSSDDQGRSWYKRVTAGHGGADRHLVCRPVNAQAECDTVWISGTGAAAAGSVRVLNRGGQTFLLPEHMASDPQAIQPTADSRPPATQPG